VTSDDFHEVEFLLGGSLLAGTTTTSLSMVVASTVRVWTGCPGVKFRNHRGLHNAHVLNDPARCNRISINSVERSMSSCLDGGKPRLSQRILNKRRLFLCSRFVLFRLLLSSPVLLYNDTVMFSAFAPRAITRKFRACYNDFEVLPLTCLIAQTRTERGWSRVPVPTVEFRTKHRQRSSGQCAI